jgi:hypothetical protein
MYVTKTEIYDYLQILRTYVEAFNAAACTTPDALSLKDLFADYNSSRMFGLGTAVAMRPLLFDNEIKLPSSGEQVSEEIFESMFVYHKEDSKISEKMRSDPNVKDVMMEIAEEVVQCLDKLKIV